MKLACNLISSLLLFGVVCATSRAVAQPVVPTFEDLQRRVSELENEIQEIQDMRGATAQRAVPQRLPAPQVAEQPSPGPQILKSAFSCSTCGSPGGLGGCGNGGTPEYPIVKVGGFFQADGGWFDQSASNIAAVGDIQNGADFRRTRLNAHGDVANNIGYMIEFDFSFPGRPSFMDVYLDVRDTSVGTFRFGQWRHPFGMDGQTSVKELTFLERGLPFAFLPFRQTGLGVFDHSANDMATWAFSAFRYPTDAFGGSVGDNGGYGLASRITFLPHVSDALLIHVGGGYSFVDPANDRVRYRNQPEVFISETGGADLVPAGVPSNVPPFVDTGAIDTSNVNLFAAEFAVRLKSLYLQSEAIFAAVKQLDGSHVTFAGAYAYAGYFLTGEIRPYNRTHGVFGRVKPRRDCGPCCGIGAWELAARWSHIDLNDGNIAGGRLNDLTAGLNWYLNARTKFQFNYVHAFLNDSFGDSDADVIACRGQIDF